MLKPTVYLETTIIGHLTGRWHADPVIVGRQTITREWWMSAKEQFQLLVSQLVVDECSAGNAEAAKERLAMFTELSFVPISAEAEKLALILIKSHAVPASEPRDALHISIAAINSIEYLLTWNFKHLANAKTRDLIEETCRKAGYDPPTICTPEELSGG